MHGDLEFVCREIHGRDRPRIWFDTKNTQRYQVVYQWGDREALKVIAKPLRLTVTREEREIQVITVRQSPDGHRLKASTNAKQVKLEDVCCDLGGRWPLDGVTVDELATFLETRYHSPVVNQTSLEGRWSILLSEKAGKIVPSVGQKAKLDDLGLELQWETVATFVTAVKDQPKGAEQ